MKRALLVGVADEHPEHTFRPGPSLNAIHELLLALGGWTVVRLEGPAADRKGINTELAALEAAVGPEDTVLFHFAGHGGIVKIEDLPAPLGGRPLFYLATARAGEPWSFTGLLDIELSLSLARIDRRCADVSVILDSCYSARVVRSPVWSLRDSPAWVHTLATQLPSTGSDGLLHPTSHPRIVRLAGSSSLRKSYADRHEHGDLGRLSGLFADVVREAQLDIGHLTWDAITHRIRERAIWRLGCEEQWVSLAGPRQRLLFSKREAPLPRSVGFVPRLQQGGSAGDGWIRAGALQGVHIGDEWGIATLTLDTQLRPRFAARVRVTAVDLNRAQVAPIEPSVDIEDTRSALFPAHLGASALLLGVIKREPVTIGPGLGVLSEMLTQSTWIGIAADRQLDGQPPRSPFAALVLVPPSPELEGERLELRGLAPGFPVPARSFTSDPEGYNAALEHLEDWARTRRLLEVARTTLGEASVAVSVSRARGPRLRPEALGSGPRLRLHVRDRLLVHLNCAAETRGRFVSALVVDPAGCLRALDEAEPDGREILRGEFMTIGEHPHRSQQGILLTWPEHVPADQSRPLQLVILTSCRPIALGHLLAPTASAGIPRPRRPRRNPLRGHLPQARPRTGPVLSTDWSATILTIDLDPRPRIQV